MVYPFDFSAYQLSGLPLNQGVRPDNRGSTVLSCTVYVIVYIPNAQSMQNVL